MKYKWFQNILWLVLFTVFSGAAFSAEGVTYFRQHGGVTQGDSARLPDRLDNRTPIWTSKLLPGNSTPCVHDALIFVTTYDSTKQQLATVALDRSTGKKRWTQIAKTGDIEPFHTVGSPASSTPVCDGEFVYVFFGSLGLLCYDVDGNLQWAQPMGPFQDEFGAASSPILLDDKIILNEDHDVDSFLIAMDKATGETIWKTPREGFTRSYSTPVVWEVDDHKRIIVAGSLQVTAYDPDDGRPVWWVRGISRIVDTTPVIFGGRLFVATWTPGGDASERISMGPYASALKEFDRNQDSRIAKDELSEGAVLTRFFRIDLNQDGALDREEWEKHARVFDQAQNVAIAIRPGGLGDVTETHVDWIYRRGLPTVPSPVVYEGLLYMVKDGGIISCLDGANGELLYRGRSRGPGNYYASAVAGDGKVYFASERGVVTILKAGEELNVLSSHDFGERIMATPVLDHDQILIRTDKALYCFGDSPR